MKKLIARITNFTILSVLLPCVYGCNSGVGGGLGSLLGGIGSDGGAVASAAGGASSSGSGAVIATIHNPEPGTMILLGTGLAAMAYCSRKNKKMK